MMQQQNILKQFWGGGRHACAAGKLGGRKQVQFPLRQGHFVVRAAIASGSVESRWWEWKAGDGGDSGRV